MINVIVVSLNQCRFVDLNSIDKKGQYKILFRKDKIIPKTKRLKGFSSLEVTLSTPLN